MLGSTTRASRHELAGSFVPKLLTNYITSRVLNRKESINATSFFLRGVCLIVDISGFTALSEAFCDAGKKGIDGLQVCTNGYIGELVSVVHTYGGDIIKFAGDALVCVFVEEHFAAVSEKKRQHADVSSEVLLRAMMCAKEVRDVRTDRLTVHVGMSCGEMCFGILGGVENRWECLISGPCLYELSSCLDDAPSKHAAMTLQCAEQLFKSAAMSSDELATSDIPAPNNTGTNSNKYRVASIQNAKGTYTFQLQPMPSGNHRILNVTFTANPKEDEGCPDLPEDLIERPDAGQQATIDALIHQFVPAPIVEELDTATGLSYFAEIREVVTMFMKWDSYDAEGKHRDLLGLQPCFYQAQRILHASGAYLRQFLVDDKGCVLIACWGMPNMSYLDNAHRALAAAAQIRTQFQRFHMETSVGITCADVYCGTVGSMERMEYAAIGSEVNMAARIMSKAKGRLLVGQTAYNHLPSADQDLLKAIPAMTVKGKTEPLQAYNYTASHAVKISVEAPGPSGADISPACKTVLSTLLDSLSGELASQRVAIAKPSPKSSRGSVRSARVPILSMSFRSPFSIRASRNPARVVLIKGKRGTGKSSVVAWLRTHAIERDISLVNTRITKQVGQRKPYMMWKKIFYQLTAKVDFQSNDGQWSHVSSLFDEVFPNMALLTEHVSLTALCEALGVGATMSERIAHLEKSGSASLRAAPKSSKRTLLSRKPAPENHAEHMREALVKVFAHLLNQQPTLLIVENVHLAGERCLDLLVHLLPKLSHPSAVVLTALIAETLPGPNPFSPRDDESAAQMTAQHAKSAMARQSSSFSTSRLAAVQANSIESSPWFLTYRPLILNHKPVTILILNNYTQHDVETMLCTALGVRSAPPELLQLVLDFSGGSFFWVREILQFIKEHGAEHFMSAIGEGKPKDNDNNMKHGPQASPLRRGPSLLQTGHLQRQRSEIKPLMRAPSFQSANSHRIVASPHHAQLDKLLLVRFGGLTQDAQRVLRTASVIGVTFTKSTLQEVLPKHLKQNMQENLDALVHQLWLFEDADNAELYAFAHPHAQQVIYELTPSSERNHLYALIAQHVEELHGTDPHYYAALSHYFLHCDAEKALQYVVKAEEALLIVHTIYDFTEAVDLLGSSLQLCKTAHDVEVMRKLVQSCRVGIQQYSRNPTSRTLADFKPVVSWGGLGRFVCCGFDKRVFPGAEGHEVEASKSTEVLLEQEQQARALFLQHLDRLDNQLTSIIVEYEDSGKSKSGDWQNHGLNKGQTKENT